MTKDQWNTWSPLVIGPALGLLVVFLLHAFGWLPNQLWEDHQPDSSTSPTLIKERSGETYLRFDGDDHLAFPMPGEGEAIWLRISKDSASWKWTMMSEEELNALLSLGPDDSRP